MIYPSQRWHTRLVSDWSSDVCSSDLRRAQHHRHHQSGRDPEQLVAGGIGLVLFGVTPGLVVSVVLGASFGLVNASSRPAFLALGSELSPRYRGALLGLLSLTNQGGSVLGSSLGGLAIALGSYGTLAVLALCGGVGAAMLAVPLARLKLAREA